MILPNESAQTSGTGVILILSFLLVLSCLYLHYSITEQLKKEKNINIKSYFKSFTLLLLIVHPLGFYIYLSQNWNMANDGQIIMSLAVNYFYSSFVFLALGHLCGCLQVSLSKVSQRISRRTIYLEIGKEYMLGSFKKFPP
ncbi:hypothetical protein MYP_907 [Sporocytophaga myxococcoides]|uniref:Uncharacterized protein n=1 Tax=Sporocytophaga myxococcoides TaxID=153721 RepID=A0A098L9R9_9BACT|nr:hypothetical protein MYP_907 [Sporocytophaga myxococcoides]